MEDQSKGNKSRRNLIFITTFLIFYKYSEAKLVFFGTYSINFGLGNPIAILHFSWIVWFYYLLQYLQYYNEVGRIEYRKAFDLFLKKNAFSFLVPPISPSTVKYSNTLSRIFRETQQDYYFDKGIFKDLSLYLLFGKIGGPVRRVEVYRRTFSLQIFIKKVKSFLRWGFRKKTPGHIKINLIGERAKITERQAIIIRKKELSKRSEKTSYKRWKFESYDKRYVFMELPRLPFIRFILNLLSFNTQNNYWNLIGIIPVGDYGDIAAVQYDEKLSFFSGLLLMLSVRFCLVFRSQAYLKYKFPIVFSLFPLIYYGALPFFSFMRGPALNTLLDILAFAGSIID
jgi:hypothetical protein